MQEQNWHDWRKKGIGASDAPIIMGVSPWKTPYQLWLEKTGKVKSDKNGNWATQRGHDLEPKARAQYELETGNNCPPRLVEYALAPYIRASLDGFDREKNIVLEIKCPGAADHSKALAGEVPEKYYPQLQHQLLVTGANCAHYYSFDGEKGVLIEVKPDISYCSKLFLKLEKFWNLVQTDTPPELSEKDYKKIKDSRLSELACLYIENEKKLDLLREENERIKSEIISHEKVAENKFSMIDNILVQKISRKGAVDYSKIPELKNVDVELYRKKESIFYKILEKKNV